MSIFRQLMMRKKGGGGILPSQYTEVDYIESSGSSYFDTEVSTTTGFRLVSTVALAVDTDDYHMVCGSHNLSYPYARNMVGFMQSSGRYFYTFVGIGQGDYVSASYISSNQYYDIDFCNEYDIHYTKVNGSELYLVTGSAYISNAFSSRNLYLFANNRTSSGASQYFKGKMKRTQIYVSGDMVRDYVPCYDTITQKYGMYDLITQNFKSSLNTDFSGGND